MRSIDLEPTTVLGQIKTHHPATLTNIPAIDHQVELWKSIPQQGIEDRHKVAEAIDMPLTSLVHFTNHFRIKSTCCHD